MTGTVRVHGACAIQRRHKKCEEVFLPYLFLFFVYYIIMAH